jgi:integrase
MASIQRHGKRWRVQVYANGVRESKVCDTKAQASTWALQREAELTGRKLPPKTFGEALQRYADDVAPGHRGARWEAVRVKSLRRDSIARRQLAGLAAPDFAAWRDERLREVSPGTVARELNLIRSALEYARRDLHWIRVNPLEDVRWPKTPPARRRRVTEEEVAMVVAAFGVEPLAASTAAQRVGLAFLLALETAMRSGEIVGLTWADVRLSERYVILPRTKNGDRREVPLSRRAVEILRALPVGDGPVFGMTAQVRDTIWRKFRPKALAELHFHDSRAEAIWRLSKRLDVLQLARVIGHRDPKSLMLYFNESAADMARRLD